MYVKSEVHIECPIQVVWNFFHNTDNMHKWLRGFQRYEHLSGEPGEIGSKGLHYYKEDKREIVLEEEITDKKEPELFVGTLSHHAMHSEMVIHFSEAQCGTLVECTVDTTFKSLFYKLFGYMMKSMFQKRQDADFLKLRDVIEREYNAE